MTPKRRRNSLAGELSPTGGGGGTTPPAKLPKTPVNSSRLTIPLSERQQLAHARSSSSQLMSRIKSTVSQLDYDYDDDAITFSMMIMMIIFFNFSKYLCGSY